MRGGVLVSVIAALAIPLAPLHAQDAEPDGQIDGLLVVGGEAPVPEVGLGAPNYSPEQTAGVICAALDDHAGQTRIFNLEKAHQATVRAKKARRDFRLGKASQGDVNGAELSRQLAVNAVMSPVKPPLNYRDGLIVENVTQRRVIENGRGVLIVTGELRNFGPEPTETPPILLYAVDARGFALASQTNAIATERLAPGETASFTVRFRNPPAYTSKIVGAVAPPFQARAFRGCGFFDPALYDQASLDV
jgi:hypothetical protein